MRIRNPFWLVLLPIAVCLADVGLTLQGQPTEYWRGNYAEANEGNPLPRLFLEVHPLAFVALVLAWIAGFTAVILLIRRRWAVLVCLVIILGHTVGTLSWLLRNRPFGHWFAVLFLLTVVVLALPTWRARSGHSEG
jgi:hypothetical protein